MTLPTHTPAGKPFVVASESLKHAIEVEWAAHSKFSTRTMPLTAFSFTAMDKIAGNETAVIEALLTYIDTDALCYWSSQSAVKKRQEEEWRPVLHWVSKKYDVIVQTTDGLDALEQPQALHEAIRATLAGYDAFKLTALCSLASFYSSVFLALMVVENEMDAEAAYDCSVLEETVQAELWGVDSEALARKDKIRGEIQEAGRFLNALDAR